MLLVIGGLSGSGKTTLGRHLNERCAFHWIDLDHSRCDVVDALNIREEWDAFCNGNSSALAKRFPGDTVLTIPSYPTVTHQSYFNSPIVRIRYLTGPKAKCFDRAHARTQQLDQNYWDTNNRDLLVFLEGPKCPPEWKIEIFDGDGNPLNVSEIARTVIGG